MWHPVLNIWTVIEVEKTKFYGAGSTSASTDLWYEGNQSLYYEEGWKLEFLCIFQLSDFPFDSQECNLYIGGYYEDSRTLTLNPLSISFNSEIETTIGEKPIIRDRLYQSYKLQLETYAVDEDISEESMSYTGMIIKLRRKSLGHLSSSYYYPTASFALLSLISYLIKPDIVSSLLLLRVH